MNSSIDAMEQGNSRQSGYSLTELLVVLAIAGLIFAVSVPFLPSATSGAAGHVELQRITSELAGIRARAMTSGSSIEVLLRAPEDGLRLGQTVLTHPPSGALWTPDGDDPSTGKSNLAFFADGTLTPGVLSMELSGRRMTLRARPWSGQFAMEPQDAQR